MKMTYIYFFSQVYWKLYGPYENKPLLACEVSQLQPRSRGIVTLRTRNPHDSPNIDPNYLADPRDIEDMVQGTLYFFIITNLFMMLHTSHRHVR